MCVPGRPRLGVRRCSAALKKHSEIRRSLFITAHLITLVHAQAGNALAARAQASTSENGVYFVTAGTYLKAHHFRTSQRLTVLERGLLTAARFPLGP